MKTRPFFTFTARDEPERAFLRLVDKYRAMHPDGNSGTIAEKGSFEMIRCGMKHPLLQAALMVSRKDPRIRDPFGPAGCIVIDESLLFFGYALS